MTIKEKFKVILQGMLVPLLIYLGITFFVAVVVEVIKVILKNTNAEFLINELMIQAIANVFAIFILLPLYLSFKKKFELQNKNFRLGKTMYLIPLSFSICIIGNMLLGMFMESVDNEVSKQLEEIFEEYGIGISLLIVSFVVPILEELLFRGFLFDSVMIISKNVVISIAVSSILFALVHGNIPQGIYAIFAGSFLGYIRYEYGGVKYSIIAHLIMNACSIIFASAFMLNDNLRQNIFTLFIMFVILGASLYRINYKPNKNSEEV